VNYRDVGMIYRCTDIMCVVISIIDI